MLFHRKEIFDGKLSLSSAEVSQQLYRQVFNFWPFLLSE